MMNEPPKTDDLHDQLVDQALREVVGGETPPDLSEQIFTAAAASGLVTTTKGDEAMTDRKLKSGKFSWGILAIAASLFIAVGAFLLLPAQQALRKVSRHERMSLETEALSRGAERNRSSSPLGQQDAVSHEQRKRVDSNGLYGGEGTSAPMADNRPTVKEQLRDKLQQYEILAEQFGGQESASAATPKARALMADLQRNQRLLAEAKRELKDNEAGKVFAVQSGTNRDHSGVLHEYELRKKSKEEKIAWHQALQRAKLEQLKQEGRSGQSRLSRLSREIDQLHRLDASSGDEVNRYLPQENLGLQGLINDAYGGRGPGNSGDRYTRIDENPFKRVNLDSTENRLSTFSIDVDTASYANVRQFLMQSYRLPPTDAVRIEELINYFDYAYSGPTGEVPFAAHVEVAGCPWQPAHRLVRVGIKGREIDRTKRPQSNLVFLVDVSGSMNQQNKLPLLVQGLKMLTRELGENDRVAIVVYASSEGLALPSTRGDKQDVILASLKKLRAGGSTAGGAGIALAYRTAQQNFVEEGVNRVILCTDGDFNVGVTSPAELERMAEKKAKETGVFLTVLGFGRGNLNDAMMEKISGKGNGNYHYIDGLTEARKVLVEEMSGTLVTIAKDVKLQIEFNPAQVAGYRLIGYENRVLAAEDFNDDKKDAGEIGAGHTVTALYEIVPAGQSVETPGVDALKYGKPAKSSGDRPSGDEVTDDAATDGEAGSSELLTLKIRYKQPDGKTSSKLEFPIVDNRQQFGAASNDFKFASAVASFGMLLRESEHRGTSSYASVLEIAEDGSGRDPHSYRAEFLQLVRRAQELAGEHQ
jgi:Ca-activated chloride channel family protein